MDAHYRAMTPAEKIAAVRDAWASARLLALAGLRLDYPDESEEQLEARWAERRLGSELYQKAAARLRELSS
ncbi:MAG: hypothetical protein O2816_14880 [Planctomycetota bacterium]|nr:hypothetical protein [Planctomycetota bacterium]